MLGEVFLGRYETVGFLGRGSMGRVFIARELDRPKYLVVIKLMHDHIVNQPRFRQLFELELQSMARFQHPYAVRLFDASLDDPRGPCIVMEYIPGVTLEVLLGKEKRLDSLRVGRFLGFLCHALNAAHRIGVIHRDLKPSNLMVIDPGSPHETLRVMDFGLAGFSAKPYISIERLTGTGPDFAVGTPNYICPEQIRGDEMDHRGDIYSVGIMLYELLTGLLPFDAMGSVQRLLEAHLRDEPLPFSSLSYGSEIPSRVEEVVFACLAKYPNERPQSAQELAERFGAAIDEDIWRMTTPTEIERRMTTVPQMPSLRKPTRQHAQFHDPYAITFNLEAWMPERIAAVKLRGFLEDVGGVVLVSEPGLIRVRLGDVSAPPPKPKGGVLGWLGRMASPEPPPAPPPPDPIEIELQMERPELQANRLHVVVICRPLEPNNVRDPEGFKARCNRIHNDLRAYLMAQE